MYFDNIWTASYVEPPNQVTLMAVILIKTVELGVLASYVFNRL